jgi:hypothetical protein
MSMVNQHKLFNVKNLFILLVISIIITNCNISKVSREMVLIKTIIKDSPKPVSKEEIKIITLESVIITLSAENQIDNKDIKIEDAVSNVQKMIELERKKYK